MNAWLCDRCGATTKEDGGNLKEGSCPPDGWRQIHLPVRGSEGARSAHLGVICPDCDDSLYDWLVTGWQR